MQVRLTEALDPLCATGLNYGSMRAYVVLWAVAFIVTAVVLAFVLPDVDASKLLVVFVVYAIKVYFHYTMPTDGQGGAP